jgi:hypothetical protein
MILKIQKSNLNMLTMTYINAQLNLLVDINIIMVWLFSWGVGYVCGWSICEYECQIQKKMRSIVLCTKT